MSKHFLSTVIIAFLFGVSAANAQETFKHWAIGIDAGSNGPGITVSTSLSSYFKLRTGVSFLNYRYPKSIDMGNITGYLPYAGYEKIELTGSIDRLHLSFTNFKALIDIYPMANGVFSISAGLFAGNNQLSGTAIIDRYEELTQLHHVSPVLDLEGMTLQPNPDGSIDAKWRLGTTWNPYFGIGLGRTIANSRLGFKFDLGVIYRSDYVFESPNAISGSDRLNNLVTGYLSDYNIPSWALKIWPVISFGLSYRLF
ncbi:MAG: hypothetical protein LBH19_05660 [Dysgonamonadaceae bacterium]|jgi:hypothetical protein|nr:hypothetical protein [Dysgonamonadaceae bacterium]